MTTPNNANEKLAEVLIHRLNDLLADEPTLGETLGRLIAMRVVCSRSVAAHPTIQAATEDSGFNVGFLGILNGMVGAIPKGQHREGWGYVMAVLEQDGSVSSFINTKYQKTQMTTE